MGRAPNSGFTAVSVAGGVGTLTGRQAAGDVRLRALTED